ncbi:hypothetical protein ACLKMH_18180 [Psychromonas sp. KJ10-10]|uniref:hypothetical protein n=1 Tax=Psychromonas sp. KJ10-10 TaxID=3391823 RepID=UPI0039B60CD9
MYSTFVYFICCIALLTIGIVTGYLFTISSFSLDNLTKYFSIIASITTVLGVILAIFNIHLWKKEYKNKKLDFLIDDLEDHFNDLCSSMMQHYFAENDLLKKENVNDYSDELNKIEQNKLQIYKENEHKYWLAYTKIQRFQKLDKNSIINPNVISEYNTKKIQTLYKIFQLNSRQTIREMQKNNLEEILQRNSSCKEEFLKLREKILDI